MKKFDELYEAYRKAVEEAYETEGHFYAAKARTPELKKKADDAYKAFDEHRKELKKQGKM